MTVIKVEFIDQVYLRVESNKKVEIELTILFSFDISKTEFSRVWRLYYRTDKKLLAGLYPRLKEFAEKNGHEIEERRGNRKPRLLFGSTFPRTTEINEKEFRQWLDGLRFESSKPQEHEAIAMLNVLRRNRAMLRFPDGNKHPVLYYLLQWFLKENRKCLLVTWNPDAVEELYKRFESGHIQKLYNRLTKNVKKPILIASWQSIYRQPEEWFDRFDAVIVDELDKFPAKGSSSRTVVIENYPEPVTKRTPQLQTLMEKITRAKYRIGLIEWNDTPKIHTMLLEGLFGTIEEIRDETSGKEHQSSLNVTRIEFNYPKDIKTLARCWKREMELKFLEQYEGRNRYIRNLACKLDGNTLVIVKKLDHGNLLYSLIREKLERDGLQKEVCMNVRPTKNEWIVIATYQKIHNGLHVDCLDNVVLSHPYKNDIQSLKSMGGNLGARNGTCNLYDIVDDLRSEERENHLIKEANKRMKGYKEQNLSVKNVRIDIG